MSTAFSTEGGSEPNLLLSGSVRWWCVGSCWMVLSHVTWGPPGCLLQSAGGRLTGSSWYLHCHPCTRCAQTEFFPLVYRAVSLGCFVSLHTSSFWTNWYHLMPSRYADTTGRAHRSYVCPSLISPSSSNHTGILVIHIIAKQQLIIFKCDKVTKCLNFTFCCTLCRSYHNNRNGSSFEVQLPCIV